MIREIIGKFGDGVSNLREALTVKRSAFGISLSKLQALQGNLIVVGRERPFFQEFFGFLGGLRRVASKHPLVKHFGWRKSWPVPEHNVEELQAFHMTP